MGRDWFNRQDWNAVTSTDEDLNEYEQIITDSLAEGYDELSSDEKFKKVWDSFWYRDFELNKYKQEEKL